MSTPMMIQEHDAARISTLQKRLKLPTKIAVLRAAISMLEQEVHRQERINRWQKAAAIVAQQSKRINKEFQTRSRSKRLKDL